MPIYIMSDDTWSSVKYAMFAFLYLTEITTNTTDRPLLSSIQWGTPIHYLLWMLISWRVEIMNFCYKCHNDIGCCLIFTWKPVNLLQYWKPSISGTTANHIFPRGLLWTLFPSGRFNVIISYWMVQEFMLKQCLDEVIFIKSSYSCMDIWHTSSISGNFLCGLEMPH